MKRNLLGAVAVVLAIGFSAFTKFAITENYLVQTSHNCFERRQTAPLSCFTKATLFCKYEVTAARKANIPALPSCYGSADIQAYLTNGWIIVAPGAQRKLYGQ